MEFLRNAQRILRSGLTNFWRNRFVTVSAVFVMTITLFVMGSLLYLGSMLDSSLQQIQERVDVNVYFQPDAPKDEILRLQSTLESRDDVAAVTYTSQQDALSEFRRENNQDDLVVQALEELEQNPLGASLNIQATDPEAYDDIVSFLEKSGAVAGSRDIISRINYYQNKSAINKLTNVIQSINTFSFIIMVVFAIIAGLIVFNTIRLAIYSARDEISVMELMGAARSYIRGPFVIEGMLYGITAALITLGLFYPLSLWGADVTKQFFVGSVSSFDYYINNFAELFVILTVAGIALGGISSYIAVRRYLDV